MLEVARHDARWRPRAGRPMLERQELPSEAGQHPRGKRAVAGRSHNPGCRRTLAATPVDRDLPNRPPKALTETSTSARNAAAPAAFDQFSGRRLPPFAGLCHHSAYLRRGRQSTSTPDPTRATSCCPAVRWVRRPRPHRKRWDRADQQDFSAPGIGEGCRSATVSDKPGALEVPACCQGATILPDRSTRSPLWCANLVDAIVYPVCPLAHTGEPCGEGIGTAKAPGVHLRPDGACV